MCSWFAMVQISNQMQQYMLKQSSGALKLFVLNSKSKNSIKEKRIYSLDIIIKCEL